MLFEALISFHLFTNAKPEIIVYNSVFGLTLKINTKSMLYSFKQAIKLGHPLILLKSYFLKAKYQNEKENITWNK